MKRISLSVAFLLACACGATAEPPPLLAAPRPTYLVLPNDSGVGYLVPSHTPRYAYGWFGAAPRTTWYRHFGYARNYTQWKEK